MGNRHLVAALGGSGGGSVVGKLGGAGAGLALGPTLRVAVSVPYHLRRHAGIAHVSINEVACYRTSRGLLMVVPWTSVARARCVCVL